MSVQWNDLQQETGSAIISAVTLSIQNMTAHSVSYSLQGLRLMEVTFSELPPTLQENIERTVAKVVCEANEYEVWTIIYL